MWTFVIQWQKCHWHPSLLPGVEVGEQQWEGGDRVLQQVLVDAERGRGRCGLPREGNAEVSLDQLLTHKPLDINFIAQNHQ